MLALDLVGHHDDAMVIAEFSQIGQELGFGDIITAFALDRFEEHGSDLVRRRITSKQGLERPDCVIKSDAVISVGKRDAVDLGWERPKADLERHHARTQSHADIGASVITVGEGDEGGAPGVVARDLDRVLHGLAAGRKEQGFLCEVTRAECVQPFGEGDIAFIGADLETGMGEVIKLRLDRLNHLLMTVTDILTTDAAAKVNIALAGDIPNFGIVGMLGRERRRISDGPSDTLIAAFLELFIGCHGYPIFSKHARPEDRPPIGGNDANLRHAPPTRGAAST